MGMGSRRNHGFQNTVTHATSVDLLPHHDHVDPLLAIFERSFPPMIGDDDRSHLIWALHRRHDLDRLLPDSALFDLLDRHNDIGVLKRNPSRGLLRRF